MRDTWRIGPLLQMSWVIALATLIPLGAGILADRLLGTAPLFILLGGLIGILAGTVGTVRVTIRAIEALSPSAPKGNGGERFEAEERKEDQPEC